MSVIYGKNAVVAFALKNKVKTVYITDYFNDEKILEILNKQNLQIVKQSKSFFDNITKNNHQGIAALVSEISYSSLDELLNKVKDKIRPVLLMCDKVQDPHNFGAIIRSVEAFGVDGIILGKHESCPINETVVKVSTGAIANVTICEVVNLTKTCQLLKDKGYWVFAAEANNGTSCYEVKYDRPMVLIVGSEGFGISPLLKKQADFNIFIPMKGEVNSLNVSVASAILLSEICK